jgi:hypothetical protein
VEIGNTAIGSVLWHFVGVTMPQRTKRIYMPSLETSKPKAS